MMVNLLDDSNFHRQTAVMTRLIKMIIQNPVFGIFCIISMLAHPTSQCLTSFTNIQKSTECTFYAVNSYEQQFHQYQQNDQPSHPKKTTTYDIGNVGLAAISLSSTATLSNHNTLYSGYSVLVGYSIAREQNRSQRFFSHKAM